MHTLTLKTVDMSVDGKTIKLSYLLQLKEIVRTPTAGLADYEEIRRSLRVLDALDKSDGKTLSLEDSDFEFMLEKVRAIKWPVIDPAIIQFLEDIEAG